MPHFCMDEFRVIAAILGSSVLLQFIWWRISSFLFKKCGKPCQRKCLR